MLKDREALHREGGERKRKKKGEVLSHDTNFIVSDEGERRKIFPSRA